MSAESVDCSDALAARVLQAANWVLRETGRLVSVLGGLRPDGRAFLVLLGGLYGDDHVRRREFVAHVLTVEGAVAYAHASYFSQDDSEGAVRMNVVAESKKKSTLYEYERDAMAPEARGWKQIEAFDLGESDHWHPYAGLPEGCEIEDAARAAEYDAQWQSLRGDETRCFWGWDVDCQVPGFPFPTAFAGRPLEQLFDHESFNIGLGYGAKYAVEGDESLDLYAYKRGLQGAEAPDDSIQDALEREFGDVCSAVYEVRGSSPATTVDLVEQGTLSFGACGAPPMTIAQFRLSSDEGDIDSFLALTVFRGLFIKIRLSMPHGVDGFDRAKAICGWLASYLGSLESYS